MDKYAIMAAAGFTRAPYDTPYGVERVAEVAATHIAELEKENAALITRLSWYNHHHTKLVACCEMLTGSLWPQNETTKKLRMILDDFPTPPTEPPNA